ncbi:MAG: hypothetical protein HY763_17230 [Planctomycetes bacterium]|nr:hypothetical protein [Planctomycetota bacterium]
MQYDVGKAENRQAAATNRREVAQANTGAHSGAGILKMDMFAVACDPVL